MLHSNNLTNVDAKFEILEEVNIIDMIDNKKTKYWLRDFLLQIKVENTKFLQQQNKEEVNIVIILLLLFHLTQK